MEGDTIKGFGTITFQDRRDTVSKGDGDEIFMAHDVYFSGQSIPSGLSSILCATYLIVPTLPYKQFAFVKYQPKSTRSEGITNLADQDLGAQEGAFAAITKSK